MIYTCYIDVTQFEDATLFQEKRELLSPYRQQKIARLKHEKDKRRSLGAGLALDHALRRYGIMERSEEYTLGEWGKPSFRYHPDIHFSLSHSGDFALCSIGDKPAGNDIERIRPGRLHVADRFFTAEERNFLYAGQDEEEITERMFRIWTMKESFLKVTGRGMTLPLQEFSVVVDEEQKIRVIQNFDEMTYHMKEYRDIPGYRVAVCSQEGSEMAEKMEPVEV